MHNTPSAAATPLHSTPCFRYVPLQDMELAVPMAESMPSWFSLCSAASRIYTVHHEARLLLETRMLPLQRRIPLVCKCWW